MISIKIGLVSCGKKKLPYEAKARNLYQGELFKKAVHYAETNYDMWFILSAKYGLLWPDEKIQPYDLTLNSFTKPQVRQWAEMVYQQILVTIGTEHQFYIHGGRNYQEVCKLLPCYTIPLKGLGIGQQLKWYNSQIESRD